MILVSKCCSVEIYSVLFSGDDVMSQRHKQILRTNRDVLVENMTPDDIFNDLISKHIFSNADVSRIKERNTVEAINEVCI